MKLRKSESGITVMELVVIIVVLSVVVAITYPKFRTMLYQSREGQTKANLGDIRGAIAIYYSDNFGLFPSDDGKPETRLADALIPQYIKKIPYVELSHLFKKKLNTVNDRLDNGGDWVYQTLNGLVYVNATHMDTEGKPISGW
ncbi:hypothetical protein BVX98_07175 [bacterium F11]|nr:hypothetical protein BVX98_07175 [bacterium F11]